MRVRLEGGPFDGRNRLFPAEIRELPQGLGLWACPGYQCGIPHDDNDGDPLHGRLLPTETPMPDDAAIYRLVKVDPHGALYRYGTWVGAPNTTTRETVNA